MTPHQLKPLLELVGLPGPARNLISRFAMEHPTAKMIKDLEFEDSPSSHFNSCHRTLVFGDSLPWVRKLWSRNGDAYKVFFNYTRPSNREHKFEKETGEPPEYGLHIGTNGHKFNVKVGNYFGMAIYDSLPGPRQWIDDEYTTRRGKQARRRSRLRHLRLATS